MTNHLLAAFSEDIEVRTRGLEREVPQWLHVRVHETQVGVIFDRDGVRVTAIRVPHGSWKNAFAYRVDTPDRSILISGRHGAEQRVNCGREKTSTRSFTKFICRPISRRKIVLVANFGRSIRVSFTPLNGTAATSQQRRIVEL